MKCVCGYKHDEDLSKDGISLIETYIAKEKITKKDDIFFFEHIPFNEIVTLNALGGKIIKIYACPKCGTLKIEVEK